MNIRHIVATTGRLPSDPVNQPVSGVVGAALSLARYQADAGNRVELWGWNNTRPRGNSTYKNVELWTSPEWAWARYGRWDFRWLAPLYWQAFSTKSQDIQHVHVDPNLLLLPRARIRLLHLQTPVPDPMPGAYKRLLKRAAAVTCCSEFIRSSFLKASGYPPAKTHVIHNGADFSAFDEASGDTLRSTWASKGEDPIILFTGAIVPQKGILELVRAFERVQSQFPAAQLIIAGSSKLWPSPDGTQAGDLYEARVRKIAKGLNVRFLGNIPRADMPSVYKAADIVCVPSIWDDPHPTVVCEAMAAGLPVVGSRAGGISETIIPEETGLLVSPGDINQLADALMRLSGNSNLRDVMEKKAYVYAKVRFNWDISAGRLLDIYVDLLNRKNDK